MLRRLLDSSIGVTGAKYSVLFLSAVAIIFTTRGLGTEKFGQYTFLMSVLTMIRTITLSSSPTLLTRYCADEAINDSIVFRLFIKIFVFSVVAGVLLYGCAVSVLDNPIRSWTFSNLFIGYIIFPLTSVCLLLDSYYRAKADFYKAQGTRFIEAWLWLIGLCVLFLTGLISLTSVLLLAVLKSLLTTVIYLAKFTIWTTDKIEKTSIDTQRKFWKDLRNLYPKGLFSFIVVTSDLFMLGYLSTSEQVGLYGLAAYFFAAMVLFPDSINYFLQSRLGDRSFFLGKPYAEYTRVSFGISIIMGFCMFFLARPIVYIISGPGFSGAVLPLQILSLAFIARASSSIFASLWIHLERYKTASFLSGCNGVLNVLMNFYALPRYGAVGAAVTSFISYTLGFFINITFLNRLDQRVEPLHRFFLPRYSDIKTIRSRFMYLLFNKAA
jgi:O-antigen/teichoic acid export membrane protein